MKNRELYRLEQSNDAVCVYFLKRNVGRVAVVFASGYARYDTRTGYGRANLPAYIIKEAREMIRPVCDRYEPCQEPEEGNTVCFTCGWQRREHRKEIK